MENRSVLALASGQLALLAPATQLTYKDRFTKSYQYSLHVYTSVCVGGGHLP